MPPTTKDLSALTYPSTPRRMQSKAMQERQLGSCRPRKAHSSTQTASGQEARKTITVSMLLCCSAFMFV